jgi:hypothetical protein
VTIDRGYLVPEGLAVDMIGNGRCAVPSNGNYRRFRFTEDGLSPRAVLGQRGTLFWNTSDEHDEYGHITEDPDNRVRMMDKRMGKLEIAAREIPIEKKVSVFGDEDADLTLYGTSLVVLYTASALYHSLHVAPLNVEYGIAAIGIAAILFRKGTPDWLRVVLYLCMGWLAVITRAPLHEAFPPAALAWLISGGVVYSIGTVILATDRPHLWPGKFTAHHLWHVCVLGGSACHFILMLRFVAQAA